MNYDFSQIFGDKEVKTTTGTGSFKPMVPPVETLEDGTLFITGFVQGVTITDWKYDEDKKQLVIDFQSPDGGSNRKYISDPATREYITSKDETKQAELSGYVLKEISNVAQRFVYQNAILKAVQALGSGFTFQQYVETIGALVLGDKDKTNQDVLLKLVFKDSESQAPRYVIAQNSYIGSPGFEPKWKSDGGQYDDKRSFTYITALPDFSSQSDTLDDIFSTGTLNPGTLL